MRTSSPTPSPVAGKSNGDAHEQAAAPAVAKRSSSPATARAKWRAADDAVRAATRMHILAGAGCFRTPPEVQSFDALRAERSSEVQLKRTPSSAWA